MSKNKSEGAGSPNTSGFPSIRAVSGKYFSRKASVGSGSDGSSAFGGSGSGAQATAQSPLFYDYRWSTPDKYYYPRDRATANSVWRDIYRRDATIGIATDMYAELPWGPFDLEGLDDPAIRKIYEDMFNALNLVPRLPTFTKDFLITGEFIPHAIFNSTKGFWEKVISHNPDYIRVQGLGLAVDQPLLWLKPTPGMRALILSSDPRVKSFVKTLPKQLVSAIRGNKEIPLDPLNTGYLARMNTSSDERGTSLYTRIYRVNMYEDFVVNSSLAVAQRNAAPIRLFKLGAADGSWSPLQSDIDSLTEMLSLAESDPLSAIIMHKNIEVDYVGVSDRALLISKEWDFVERMKLLAMGVSKAFLVGETSYAAAVAGLQTLMERLASYRLMFEQQWIISKLCVPVSEMHGFYKRPQSELEHRIRVQKPGDRQLLVPKIKWHKTLTATEESSRLQIWKELQSRGLMSERTLLSGAGLDLDVERRHRMEESDYKREDALEKVDDLLDTPTLKDIQVKTTRNVNPYRPLNTLGSAPPKEPQK